MSESARYQAKTRYDKEACDALAFLMMNRLRKWPRIILLVTGLLSIVGAAWYMLQAGEVTVLPILLLLAGNFMSVFGLFARQFAAKMLLNSVGKDAENTYVFTDEQFLIRGAKGDERAYGYDFIRRVIRMSGYLFFFMRDGQTYLLKEANVPGGGFQAFLDERLAARKGKE